MTSLEPPQVGVQPKSDVVDPEVNRSIDVGRKSRRPVGVRHGLPRSLPTPSLSKVSKVHLNVCRRNFFMLRDSETRRGVITFYDGVGVQVLRA